MKPLTILAVLLASITPASAAEDDCYASMGEYECPGEISVKICAFATDGRKIILEGLRDMIGKRLDLDLRRRVEPKGQGHILLNGKRCRPRIDEGHHAKSK